MVADGTKSNVAQECCTRCGSILSIFEEDPDGSVIYCACRCLSESTAPLCHRCGSPLEKFTEVADAGAEAMYIACPCSVTAVPPPTERRSVAKQEARRCRSCGGVLRIVGTRPDGSPIEMECPCQRAKRSGQDGRQAAVDGSKILRRENRGAPNPGAKAGAAAPPVYFTRPRKSGGGEIVLAAVGLVFVVGAVSGYLSRRSGDAGAPDSAATIVAPPAAVRASTTQPSALRLPDGIEIRTDGTGAVTLVSGTDPAAVLRAFCRHPQFKSALVPGTVQSTTPPDPDLLLGSAMLMDGAGTLRFLMLKRDPHTLRWSIGDGDNAIAPEAAPSNDTPPVAGAK